MGWTNTDDRSYLVILRLILIVSQLAMAEAAVYVDDNLAELAANLSDEIDAVHEDLEKGNLLACSLKIFALLDSHTLAFLPPGLRVHLCLLAAHVIHKLQNLFLRQSGSSCFSAIFAIGSQVRLLLQSLHAQALSEDACAIPLRDYCHRARLAILNLE